MTPRRGGIRAPSPAGRPLRPVLVYECRDVSGTTPGSHADSDAEDAGSPRTGGKLGTTYMDPTHRDAREIRTGRGDPNVVFVGTRNRIPLDTDLELDRPVPEGTVSVRIFRRDTGARIGQFAALEDSLDGLRGLFEEPRQVGMSCVEEYPGVVGQLLVLLPPIALSELLGEGSTASDEEDWRASLDEDPDLGAAGTDANAGKDPEDDQLAALHAGNVVRFAADRQHPESLTREAADLLRDALEGPLPHLSERLIEELAAGASSDG